MTNKRRPNAKLTAEQVRLIRTLAYFTLQRNLAAKFKVSKGLISRIVSRDEWGWVK